MSDADKWIVQVGNRDATSSAEAAKGLVALGEEGLEITLQYASGMRRRISQRYIEFLLSQQAVMAGGAILILLLTPHRLNFLITFLLMIAGGSISAMIFFKMALARMVYPEKERKLVRLLLQFDDIRAIPFLLEILNRRFIPQSQVVECLIRQITKLREEGEISLTNSQRQNLYLSLRKIHFRKEIDLGMALLRLVAIVGDREAVPYVRRLANDREIGLQESAIREVAQHCLEALETKFTQTWNVKTLLRGSTAEIKSNAELLRAPSELPTENMAQLLHPMSGDHQQKKG